MWKLQYKASQKLYRNTVWKLCPKTSTNDTKRVLMYEHILPNIALKTIPNWSHDGPGDCGEASGPPSGNLFENGRGGSFFFWWPLGRLWDPGAPQSLHNPFRLDFLSSHFNPKVGKEASKKALKKRPQKNVEKWRLKAPKWYKNGCLNHWFFILFRKRRKRSRLLFSHIIRGAGTPKTIKNLRKICAKSMLEKVIQKWWRMLPIWSQNGRQNVSQIWKIKKSLSKSTSENRCENGAGNWGVGRWGGAPLLTS